jgi:hypothetical protein
LRPVDVVIGVGGRHIGRRIDHGKSLPLTYTSSTGYIRLDKLRRIWSNIEVTKRGGAELVIYGFFLYGGVGQTP